MLMVAMLLRSLVLGTVEGGGVGSKGCATVRRGGEEERVSGSRVWDPGSSAIEAVMSWARVDERRLGMYDTMLFSVDGGGRGRVRLPMTVDHSLMGRSWDMRITGMRGPLVLRSRSSVMWFWIRALESSR